LNQDYTPLLVISWQRALCKQIIGKEIPGEGIRVIEYYKDEIVYSAGGDFFPIPAVAVSNRYVRRKRQIALKKRNIYIRDKKTCQYCGEILSPKSATIDHVKPKSQFKKIGHANTWDNVVIACLSCNSRKDNRTPEQAGMILLTVPKEPDVKTFYTGISALKDIPDEWRNYVHH